MIYGTFSRMTISSNNAINVKQARQILQSETSSELIVGQKWYILDLKWWLDFVGKIEGSKNENDVIQMPPISNEDLICEGEGM